MTDTVNDGGNGDGIIRPKQSKEALRYRIHRVIGDHMLSWGAVTLDEAGHVVGDVMDILENERLELFKSLIEKRTVAGIAKVGHAMKRRGPLHLRGRDA